MPTKVIMPQLGESVVEGTVSKWLKQEGESIQELESLLEINTDKVDSEIPSPAGGTLLKILVPEGETVRAGTILAWIGEAGEAVPGQAGNGGAGQAAPEARETAAAKPAQAIQETAETPELAAVDSGAATQPVAAAPDRNGHSGNGGNGQATAPVPAPGRSRELGFISPIVARLAQENNIDLTQVTGTGEGGRITKKDVLAFVENRGAGQPQKASEAVPAPWETPADGDLFRPTEMVFGQKKAEARAEPAQVTQVAAQAPTAPAQPARTSEVLLPGEGQVVPLSTMRRKIAEHMVISKRTSPHVTTVMEADLHRMIAHFNANKDAFARDGVRLTYTAYFVAAAVQALRAYPVVNSSWTDAGLLIHPKINMGLAVSLGDEGLIVPVIKNAGDLSLAGLARVIGETAGRARGHKLQPEDVKDGTFTITNHGISGSLFATPIINQPQCGILGVGAIQKRVVVVEDESGSDSIAIRPMVYLSLTFDHRILDGASADGFLSKVVEALEKWK